MYLKNEILDLKYIEKILVCSYKIKKIVDDFSIYVKENYLKENYVHYY